MPNPESVILNLVQNLFRAGLFQHLVCCFLPSADSPFIRVPTHRPGSALDRGDGIFRCAPKDLVFLGRSLKDMNGEVNPSASSIMLDLQEKGRKGLTGL